jgi:hypothetical protein
MTRRSSSPSRSLAPDRGEGRSSGIAARLRWDARRGSARRLSPASSSCWLRTRKSYLTHQLSLPNQLRGNRSVSQFASRFQVCRPLPHLPCPEVSADGRSFRRGRTSKLSRRLTDSPLAQVEPRTLRAFRDPWHHAFSIFVRAPSDGGSGGASLVLNGNLQLLRCSFATVKDFRRRSEEASSDSTISSAISFLALKRTSMALRPPTVRARELLAQPLERSN